MLKAGLILAVFFVASVATGLIGGYHAGYHDYLFFLKGVAAASPILALIAYFEAKKADQAEDEKPHYCPDGEHEFVPGHVTEDNCRGKAFPEHVFASVCQKCGYEVITYFGPNYDEQAVGLAWSVLNMRRPSSEIEVLRIISRQLESKKEGKS